MLYSFTYSPALPIRWQPTPTPWAEGHALYSLHSHSRKVSAALCGVTVTLGWAHKGLFCGSGSVGNTSSTACRSHPRANASTTAASA
eukprot:1191479-Prorocentrum_minimum.AAC.4